MNATEVSGCHQNQKFSPFLYRCRFLSGAYNVSFDRKLVKSVKTDSFIQFLALEMFYIELIAFFQRLFSRFFPARGSGLGRSPLIRIYDVISGPKLIRSVKTDTFIEFLALEMFYIEVTAFFQRPKFFPIFSA